MTSLKQVNFGHNKYCGPAVLSILTGKSTDECARAISKINGHYTVAGVLLADLLKAADSLGFTSQSIEPQGSLYRTLTSIANNDGIYILTVPGHFISIEVKDKKIYFCDNHTKEPMPAASSARMLQAVVGLNKIVEKPKPPKPALLPENFAIVQMVECQYCKDMGKTKEEIYHRRSCEYNNARLANEEN